MHPILETVVEKVTENAVGFVANVTGEKYRSFSELDENVKHLEMKVESLSSRASDMEKEVTNSELSGSKKRKREVETWLEESGKIQSEFPVLKNEVLELEARFSTFVVLGILRKIKKRVELGSRVTKMINKVAELTEQSRHFKGLWTDDHEIRGVLLLPADIISQKVKRCLDEVVSCLSRGGGVSSIGIYGSEGVGKTNLAMHVNNLLLADGSNYFVHWVTVTPELSVYKLQDDIARSLGVDLSKEDDVEKRAAILCRVLKTSMATRINFFIILDGVCDDFPLEKLGNPLRINGIRLIITTRSEKTCRKIGCQEKYELKNLDKDDAWALFMQELGQHSKLPPDVLQVAESVAEECGGLPVKIITVAKTMRGVTDICEWRDKLEKIRSINQEQPDIDMKSWYLLI